MAPPAPQAPSALIAPSAQDDHSLAETVAEKTGSPLGERLAAYRKLNALSLEEVSTRAGITKSYLSKLERGLSSPTIATLIKLANALGITSEQLINANGAGSEIMLVKAGERVPFSRSRDRVGYTYEAIAAQRADKAMMPFIMSPPAVFSDEQELVSHPGEELIFLISGTMDVVFRDQIVHMTAGDSLYFNASIPHRSRSTGDTPAQALVVLSDPTQRRQAMADSGN